MPGSPPPGEVAARPAGAADERQRPLRRALPLVLAALLAAAGLNVLAARWLNSPWHPYVLLACLAPLGVPALALAAVAFAAWRRRLPALVMLAIAMALAVPYLPVAYAAVTGPAAPAGTGGLRVISFNMRLGQADAGEVVSLVRRERADVLSLQELTPAALARLELAGLSGLLPQRYAEPAERAAGLAIFSRLPLSQPHYRVGFGNHVISAVLQLPAGGALTFFASHLVAPWPQPAGPWQAENRRLGQLLGGVGGCVVDAGDFNASTDHPALRGLMATGHVADAANQAGALTLRTYPADTHLPPLVAIDHVLVRGLDGRAARSVQLAGSDHRALVTTLAVGKC